MHTGLTRSGELLDTGQIRGLGLVWSGPEEFEEAR